MAEEYVVEAKLTEDQELAMEAVIKAFEMRRLLPRENPMRKRVEAIHEEFKMQRKCVCRRCLAEREKAQSSQAESVKSKAAESMESKAKRVKY